MTTRATRFPVLTLLLLCAMGHLPLAAEAPDALCRLAIHEERIELESAELGLDLARSSVAAFEKIFKMIEDLWKSDAIERMAYLQARYDFDAARLALDRAELVLARQEALIEQYRVLCEESAEGTAAEIDRWYERYREAHCGVLTKDVEIAQVNLTFDRELLASVRDLREAHVATVPDVILAELEVEQEEKRLATGKRRAAACRRELGEPEPAAR